MAMTTTSASRSVTPPPSSERSIRTVFVTGVPEAVGESNLKEMFQYCGRIARMKRQWDNTKGVFGWEVEYEKGRAASLAMGLDNVELGGANLTIEGTAERIKAPINLNASFMEQAMTAMVFNKAQAGMGAANAAELLEMSANIAACRESILSSQRVQSTDPIRVSRTIYVGNVPKTTSETDLINLFSTFGPITNTYMPSALSLVPGIVKDEPTVTHALVEFMDSKSVAKSLKLDGVKQLPQSDPKAKPCYLSVTASTVCIPSEHGESESKSVKSLQSVLNHVNTKGERSGKFRRNRSPDSYDRDRRDKRDGRRRSEYDRKRRRRRRTTSTDSYSASRKRRRRTETDRGRSKKKKTPRMDRERSTTSESFHK
eukprot:TRINITY_DN12622_c0_g1_i1.p1 TRINITY_DN12622_c0_g1~~TRINITY_DN12622_c0_g1_i1.p1  ORF type:complete len:371 (+),score=37.73 TRINITY_DN12622_c0_g1_i1:38-1150(+)